MALYIRDDAVRQLASELARREGRTVTETVRAALLQVKEKLEADRAARDAKARAVIEELRAMRRGPVREDVLYDEQGQPRL
ncbi:MAG: type II toxin-antitoxin system VapB family antitoxin [Geminicoccaceae bacterium]